MIPVMPDVEFLNLIERCKNGEAKALEKLYNNNFGLAISVCLRYCKTREEADEVVHDGFMKVFKNLDKYKPSHSFQSWLKRIMINASIDFYRSQQKHYYHQDIENAYNQSSQIPSAESDLGRSDIMSVLETLPNSYRINFTLFAIEGFSHKEIGQTMGISEGTSKSNVSRARMMLREKLEELSYEKVPKHTERRK